MGHKVHPTGFRIGVIYDWESKWFANRDYRVLLQEDLAVRRYLSAGMRDAAISRVEIERNANIITVTIHTAKPGIVIGRSGQKVDELRNELEALTGKRIRVNIQEIRMPELDAYLVARNIADQLERRVAFRRALRQTVQRTMARGAEGCKAQVGGRLGGAEMSRKESTMAGRVPLHTLRADIDFGHAEAATTFGRIGVKVWIYKGEKLPEKPVKEEATAGAARAAAEEAETPAGAAQAEEPATAETPAGAAQAEEPATAEAQPEPSAGAQPEAPADTEAAAPEPKTSLVPKVVAEDAPAEAATEEEKPANKEQG
ncbi:MAG: 30S ribosomal protein S3 [Chloroflexi bacterium]|nr:30S ribosomal protein S3 [Chloroflexota bacterium]